MQAHVVLAWPCTASAATADSTLSDMQLMTFIIRMINMLINAEYVWFRSNDMSQWAERQNELLKHRLQRQLRVMESL